MFAHKHMPARSVGVAVKRRTRLLQALLERFRNAELVPPRELGRDIQVFSRQSAPTNAFAGRLFILVSLGSIYQNVGKPFLSSGQASYGRILPMCMSPVVIACLTHPTTLSTPPSLPVP